MITFTPANRPSVIFYADAQTLTGQTDGSPLTGTGFGGMAPDGSYVEPTYHATGIGGKPALGFNGSNQRLAISVSSAPNLYSAINGGSWTIQIIYQPSTTSGIQSIFGQASSGLAPWITTQNNIIVSQDGGNPATSGAKTALNRTPSTSTPNIFAISYNAGQSQYTCTLMNCDGSFYQYSNQQPAPSTTTPWSVGLGEGGSYGYSGQIAQICVDNICLSQQQLHNDLTYWRSKYTPTKIAVICTGDSRTAGTDTSSNPGVSSNQTPYPYPLQMSSSLGSSYDVHNVGVPSQTTSSLLETTGTEFIGATSAVNPLAHAQAIFPILLGVNDFLGGSVTTTQAAENIVAGIGAINTYVPIPCKFILTSELDKGNGLSTWITYRTALTGAIQSALPATPGSVGYVDTASNAYIGVAGSSSNSAYWSPDELHPTGESSSGVEGGGYAILAGLIGPAVVTLAGQSGSTAVYPTDAQVLTGITFGPNGSDYTGNVVLPSAGQVESGVTFGASSGETGTYAGSGTFPAQTNVRSGITYGSSGSNETGTLIVPPASTVLSTETYDATTVGTVVLPSVSQVESGITFGASSSLTGTYSGGGSGVTLSQLESTLASGITTLNLTQTVPLTNTLQTVGDALNAARANGFGKIVYSPTGGTFVLYAPDETTVVHSFNVTTDSNGNILGRS